jgi:hypothetical protein
MLGACWFNSALIAADLASLLGSSISHVHPWSAWSLAVPFSGIFLAFSWAVESIEGVSLWHFCFGK